MSISIQFGPGNSVTKPVEDYVTVRDAVEDSTIADFLGYDSENVDVRLNGETVTNLDTRLSDNDAIVISQKAQTKG